MKEYEDRAEKCPDCDSIMSQIENKPWWKCTKCDREASLLELLGKKMITIRPLNDYPKI
jgi:tRNA(Ile2) C34 agmatinyltransferase TiaS